MSVLQKVGLVLSLNLAFVGVYAKDLLTDLAAGGDHFCALFESGKIKCWGYGEDGQLGYGSPKNRGDSPYELGKYWPEVDLGQGFLVKQLSLGNDHSCALSRAGEIKCWGANGSYQIGIASYGFEENERLSDEPHEIGEAIPYLPLEEDISTEGPVAKIVGGHWFSCVLFTSGRMKCWGFNRYGLLGVEDEADVLKYKESSFVKFSRKITNVFAGSQAVHVCFTDELNNLYCYGENTFGALGAGSDVSEIGPKSGDISMIQPIKLGSRKRILDVRLGQSFTCVHFEDGVVKCFGGNTEGQLGLGHSSEVGNSMNDMGDDLKPVGFLGNGFRSIDVGQKHVCGISMFGGSVQCWGYNLWGQLGIGNSLNLGGEAYDLTQELNAVDLGELEIPVKTVTASTTSCAILKGKELAEDYKVKCWGYGGNGELAFPGFTTVGATAEWLSDRLPYIDFGQ